jgi:hypothetical protein
MHRTRKARPKVVTVKLESFKPNPVSPKTKPSKRELNAFMASDAKLRDDRSINGLITKGPKGGKGKQPKASGSKVQVSTCKLTHLNTPPEKKARFSFSDTLDLPETLFRHLGAKFAALVKTFKDIAEYLGK